MPTDNNTTQHDNNTATQYDYYYYQGRRVRRPKAEGGQFLTDHPDAMHLPSDKAGWDTQLTQWGLDPAKYPNPTFTVGSDTDLALLQKSRERSLAQHRTERQEARSGTMRPLSKEYNELPAVTITADGNGRTTTSHEREVSLFGHKFAVSDPPSASPVADAMDDASFDFSMTPEGRQLKSEMQRAADGITDRYAKEYAASPEYKQLAARAKAEGWDTARLDEEAGREFSSLYGKRIDSDWQATGYDERWYKELNSRYGGQLAEAEKQQTAADLATVGRDIDSLYGRLVHDKEQVRMGRKGYDADTYIRWNAREAMLDAARDQYEDAQRIVDEARRDTSWGKGRKLASLGRGVADIVGDIDTWTAGFTDLDNAQQLNTVLHKVEAGDDLTPEQTALMDALTYGMAARAAHIDDVSGWYKAGEVTGESIPFILEMLVNPISSAGSAATKTILKYGLRRYGLRSVASASRGLARRVAGLGTRRGLSKALGAATQGTVGLGRGLASGVARGAGMAATTGGGRVMAGAMQRQNDDYAIDRADDGRYVATGGDETLGESIVRSFASTAFENASEMSGDLLGRALGLPMRALGKAGAARAVGSWLSKSRAGQIYRAISGNMVAKTLRERAHVTGVFGEYLEEVYSNALNAAVGNGTWGEVVDPAQNVQTFLSLVPMQVGFGLLGLGGYAAQSYASARERRSIRDGASYRALSMMDMLDNTPDALIDRVVTGLSANASYTPQERETLVRYGIAVKQGRELSHAAVEMSDDDRLANDAYTNGQSISSPAELHDAWLEYLAVREEASGVFSDEDMGLLETMSPGQALQHIDGKDRGLALELMSARARVNGAEAGIGQRARDASIAAARTVRNNTNEGSGRIILAAMSDGSRAYVVSGSVSLNDDGSIDRGGSSESLVVRDASTGKARMADASEVSSIEADEEAGAAAEEAGRTAYDGVMRGERGAMFGIPAVGEVANLGGVPVTVTAVGDDGVHYTLPDGTAGVLDEQSFVDAVVGPEVSRRMAERASGRDSGQVSDGRGFDSPIQNPDSPSQNFDSPIQNPDSPGRGSAWRVGDGVRRGRALGTVVELPGDGTMVVEWSDGSVSQMPVAEAEVMSQDGSGVEPQPVGRGLLGNIYDQFRGKAKAAIDFLTKRREGVAQAALHHKDIGDIDLAWGNSKMGLEHIVSKHPDVLDGLQERLDDMDVVEASDNRVVLESNTHKAVVSKMLGQEKTPQWLLTAYEKKDASGGSSDIVPEPQRGKQNGTAPLQDIPSTGKVSALSADVQGRSLTSAEADTLIAEMEAQAEAAPEMELTPANWQREFGADGMVDTPLGKVKMGENQITKLFAKGRDAQFGMIRPTLASPDVVLEKDAPAQGAERETKYLFIKTFVKPDGSRFVYFESVTVKKDGMEVSISSHEADRKVIKKEMQNGKVLHLNERLSLGFERYLTETPNAERPDLVPTSDNVFPTGKDTTPSGKKQGGVATSPIPRDSQGQPDYERADPDAAWDAIVEQTGGDEAMAQAVADSMVADKEAALKKAERAKPRGGVTIAEKIAAERDRKEAVERAKASLTHWQRIALTRQRRQMEAQTEQSRRAEEAARSRREQEERQRAELEEAERIRREALNGVPDIIDDTPQDARARGYRRVNGEKIDRQAPLALPGDISADAVNRQFNDELQRQVDGTLPKGHIYRLGRPGGVLLSTGFPDLPIELSSTRLEEKAWQRNHEFDIADVRDLAKAINNPLAVFSYGNKDKAQNVVVEIERGGKKFVVGISLNPVVGGRNLEVNSIRSLFPKDNAEWLNWIAQGKLLYVDKQKIQALMSQQRTILADVGYLDLDAVANIVENFENPDISIGNGAILGNEVHVKFDDQNIPAGRVALIEASRLQPSHINGQRNPLHFIDEAQPKERNDEASVLSARRMAANIRPEEITSSVTAYTGAPTVNVRGEVIQGNNRSAALREMWAGEPAQAQKYRQYLTDHAADFGLTPEDVEAMRRPVLVSMVDVSDDEAITLGQFVAQDTESGGTERIKPRNVVQRMGGDMRSFASRLLSSSNDEMTFSELVDRNGMDVLKWMQQRGHISPTQYRSAFDNRGNLTAEAKNDLRGIMYQSIFQNGNTHLEEMFGTLPAKAQKAILATAYRDYDSPNAERMNAELQASISAYHALSQMPDFASAKNYREARLAAQTWQRQYAIDDVTGESYLPSDRYSNFAVLLAVMYKGQTQSFIQNTLDGIFDLVQGTQEATLFEQPDNTPRTLVKAINEAINARGDELLLNGKFTYDGQRRSNVLAGGSAASQQGRQGSTGDAPAGGRAEGGARTATDNRGTETRLDARQSGLPQPEAGGRRKAEEHPFPQENTQSGQVSRPTIAPRLMTDSEKEQRGDMLRNAPAIDVEVGQIVSTPELSARKVAERWWDENVPEPVFYDTEVGEVEINRNSVESSLAHRYGQAKLDAITSLVEGFENAVYLGTLPDSRERGVVDHYFAYPINYKGKRNYVFCRAMQDANKNRLYVHEVFVADNIKKGDTLQTAASKPHGGIALYKDILANVLGETSEPTNSRTYVDSNLNGMSDNTATQHSSHVSIRKDTDKSRVTQTIGEKVAKTEEETEQREAELASRVQVNDDDWQDGDGERPIYKRSIIIDGTHTATQIDEPDENGHYTGSYFEFDNKRFGDIAEIVDYIDNGNTLASKIEQAEAETDANPTEAQKEAGNYKKGHVRIGQFNITVENPKGSVRRGTDANGNPWETTMQNTYGYIRGTEGVDGDHIDVFLTNDIDGWNGRRVYVVDQYNEDGTFDEHKVMLGFNEEDEARDAYFSNYSKGWSDRHKIVMTSTNLEDFEKWIDSSHRKTKPFAEYRSVNKINKADNANDRTGKAAQIEKLRNSKPVEITGKEIEPSDDLKQYRKNANEYGLSHLRGEYINKDTGKKISVSKNSIKEVTSHDASPVQFQSVAAIPQILENSIYIDSVGNEDLEKHRDVSSYDYYVCGLRVKGIDYTVKAVVANGFNGERYYDHRLTKIEKGELISLATAMQNHGSETNSPLSVIKDKRLLSILQKNYRENDGNGANGLSAEAHEAFSDIMSQSAHKVEINDSGVFETKNTLYAPITVDGKSTNLSLYQEEPTLISGEPIVGVSFYRDGMTYQEASDLSEAYNRHAGKRVCADGNDDLGINFGSIDEAVRFEEWLNVANEPGAGFEITPAQYTTKRGKVLDMSLVKFAEPLSKEQQRAAKELAKAEKGWYDRDKGGFMMRSEESAQKLVNTVMGDEETVNDAQPLSLADMQQGSEPAMRQVDVEGLMQAINRDGEAKLSDHFIVGKPGLTERLSGGNTNGQTSNTEAGQANDTYGADNRLVSRARYEELKKRMRQKLGGQLNMGIDPDILAIGTEMAAYHIEAGTRRFADYARRMIADLGDAIRPYLKSFYNGARDLPEVQEAGYADEMTPYDEVRTFDTANFDKTSTDALATAETVVAEQEIRKQAEKAKSEIINRRNNERRKEDEQTAADTEVVAGQAEAVADEAERRIENATDEKQVNETVEEIDRQLDKVNEQLALLGYYEADQVEGNFNEAYGYMRNAEKKAVKDANRLANSLVKDLGIDPKTIVDKKGKRRRSIAMANIAPIGGDISIHLPLGDKRELYISIQLDKQDDDNLKVTGGMLRIENPNPERGEERYLSSNNFFAEDETYQSLLRKVQQLVKHYAPDFVPVSNAQQEAPTKTERKQGKRQRKQEEPKIADLFSAFEEENRTESQDNSPFQKGDAVIYHGKPATVYDFDDDGRLVLDTGLAPVLYDIADPKEVKPANTASPNVENAEINRTFANAVKTDMLAALDSGTRPYRSILDLRKRAAGLGMEVDNDGRTDILLQELVEDGLVRAAREVVKQHGRDSRESYDLICKLYDMQPTIAARSSNRIKMQQYSTPLPMAWNAAHFAMSGKKDGKVLEPTAGNGMLVFSVPAQQVHANELDETRLDNLREQGFAQVTRQDAAEPFEGGQQYDVIIANPPFGKREEVEYDGKMIPGLDPQITLNALASMKDDGKAAIIIGGNMEYGNNGGLKSMKPFFTYLYDHYNVKGVVDMDGRLYAKQGTTYPTRMILIAGRRSDEERAQTAVYPPVESKAIRKAESFDDLYDIIDEVINSKEKTNGTEILRSQQGQLVSVADRPSRNTDGKRHTGQSRTDDTSGRGRRAPVEGTQEQGEVVLRGEHRTDTGDGETRRGTGGNTTGGSRGVPEPDVQRVDRVGVSTNRVGLSPEPKKRNLTEEKLPYRPHNSAFSLESVAPAAMVEAMDNVLSQIEAENGNIDEFVKKELGYDTIEETHQALAAEQIDSVAMAIYQMKKGQALIIGDQTGVGKGRQMAALIRWAVKRGEKPIFITQKADLFSDIYRDLVDIGSGDLVPFIFNSPSAKENKGEMVDANGKVVYKGLSDAKMKKVMATGKLPDEYDYAVLTYSQVNSGDEISQKEAEEAAKKRGDRTKKSKASKDGKATPKATFLRAIAEDNYLFLDESHTAAGTSNTGAYLQSILRSAKAATFASATFAKRPDTMPLYAIRTAMSQAKVEPDKLIGIIEKGGVTLQEIMSRELTNAGQMVRRERDMSDVVTDWKTITDPVTVKRSRENYDRTIAAFNAIIKFQEDYVKPMVDAMDKELAVMAESAGIKRGTDKLGISNVPFASKTYNYTKQLMLALKVDAIANEVDTEIKAGRHPVIALESTMESSIKDYSAGEVIEEPTFSASLLRGLDTVMQYTIKDENGKEQHARYSPKQLGEAGEKAYYELQDFIRKSTSDIFISPLDAIIERLHGMGYKVGELTGRNMYVERDDEGRVVVKRRTDKDKKRMQREFNSGELDVLILNKSASTGISLHASEKFSDQRQRTMIIAQPLSDINDYMQMIGRIDRTGQVHRGYYINLGLPVPAENRFLMMLSTKLKSLNANTTTSQDSESNDVEAPDLLNKYGSQVVVEYLRDNPEIYEKMGSPLKKSGEGSNTVSIAELEEYKPQEDDARKITGYVALLTTKEQEEFYDDVVRRYNELIKYLNDTGSNDLKITVMPLRAKTLSKRVSSEGIDPTGTNPFARNSYVERVEMDVLRKPMKAAEIRKTIAQVNKGKRPEDYIRQVIATIEKEDEARVAAEEARYERSKVKAQEDIAKQTDKINRQQKRTAEEKQAAIADYVRETNDNVESKHNDNMVRINTNSDMLKQRLHMFEVGKSYLMPDNLESMVFDFSTPAIFCGYKSKDSKITASTTLAVFATLDGRRRMEVKLSQPEALRNIYKATNDNWDAARSTTLENWDSQIPTGTRKTGFIMTGNILQAIADTQDEHGGYPGQLISYTDIDGNVHDGILMPDKWNTSMLKTSGAPIISRLKQIKDYMPVTSHDGKVEITGSSWAKVYYLTIPKTKKDGAVYYEDKALLRAVHGGNFYPYRGKLRADITEENIEKVVRELSKLGVKVKEETNEDDALYRLDDYTTNEEEANDLFRVVDDASEITRLNSEPTIKVYRAMSLVDGKLYPPMSKKIGTGSNRISQSPSEFGQWEVSDERPELVEKDGTHKNHIYIVKDNGKGLWVAYNPYFHTSRNPLNDQFAEAYQRPSLVTVEVEVPESELTSGYQAEGAKDPVGETKWNAGPVNRQLSGDKKRKVILSRWMRPVRIVPDSEVAQRIAELIEGENVAIPDNTVTPSLLEELKKLGVKIVDGISKGRKKATAMMRGGNGALTDDELSYENDPMTKMTGRSRRTAAQRRAFAERERQRMVNAVQELAEKLHLDNVDIVTDASTLQGRHAKAKGFYSRGTGRITIVIPNHTSVYDVEQTLLHEAVAHYGLRQLFGEHFDTFLDNVFQNADNDVRRRITELARERNWDFRTATEEYLASLAENTNFDNTDASWWQKIKELFLRMLHKIGFEDFSGVTLSDNELRYILWRSYENLAEPGRYRSILGEAEDVVMQSRLKVGNYAEAAETMTSAAEPAPVQGDGGKAARIEKLRRSEPVVVSGNDYQGKYELNNKSANKYILDNLRGEYINKDTGDRINLTRKGANKSMHHDAENEAHLKSAAYIPQIIENAIFLYNEEANTKDKTGFDSYRYYVVGLNMGGVDYTVRLTVGVKDGQIYYDHALTEIEKNSLLDGIDLLKRKFADKEAARMADYSDIKDKRLLSILQTNSAKTDDSDTLFREADTPEDYDKAIVRERYDRRVRSFWYNSAESMFDSMQSLKEAMQMIIEAETGGTRHIEEIAGYENAYLGENRLSSKNESEGKSVARHLFKPLLDEAAKLAKDKASRTALYDYMMAKHGLERNRVMALREAQKAYDDTLRKHPHSKKTLQDFIDEYRDRDFAGLTGLTGTDNVADAEAEARRMVDAYEAAHDTDALWERVRAVTDYILDKSLDTGLLSREGYDRIKGMYTHYIPLRGFAAVTSPEAYTYLDSVLTGAASVIKEAGGRTTKADDPLAQLSSMLDSVIMQGNRNQIVKQRFLNFVLNHPSDLVSVSELYLEHDEVKGEWRAKLPELDDDMTPSQVSAALREFDRTMSRLVAEQPERYRLARQSPDIPYVVPGKATLREHQVLVHRGGRTVVLTINGNPRLAQALNGATNPDGGTGMWEQVLRIGESVNRQLAAFYTTRRPDFVLSNFMRDAVYTNTMAYVKEGGSYGARFNVNYGRFNPASIVRLIVRYEAGQLDESDETERLFRLFMDNGGETGYTMMRDMEAHKRAVTRALRNSRRLTAAQLGKMVGGYWDIFNRGVENCARFAAFVTSMQSGRSLDRSIWDAKEISVNFNKKGSGFTMYDTRAGWRSASNWVRFASGAGRSAFVFFNAALQGTSNFARATARHPVRAVTAMATMYLLGTLAPVLASMFGSGDDDDDYYDLPDFVRRTNWVIPTGGHGWICIPLPVEYRAIYGLGELSGTLMGGEVRMDGAEIAMEVASQLSQLMPINLLEGGGGSHAWHALVPSAVAPIVEIAVNRDWLGLPVYKDTPYNKEVPEWRSVYRNTNELLVSASRWLNDASGGNDVDRGTMGWLNPAAVEHLLTGYLGGYATTVGQMVNMAGSLIRGEEMDVRNVPLLNRVYKRGTDRTEARHVNEEYWKLVEEAGKTTYRLRGYREEAARGVTEYAERIVWLNRSPEYARYAIMRPYMRAVKRMEQARGQVAEGSQADSIDKAIIDLKRQAVEACAAVE